MIVGELVDDGVAEIRTGPFGTQLKASAYVESGRPVLNVRNVGMGEVRAEKLEYIDEATADRLAVHLLEEGDIVFGRKGAVERHAFIKGEFAGALQGSDCIRLRLRPGAPVRPHFVSFALRTAEHQAWMQAYCSHGATMASLNQGILRQIRLPDLSLHTQDAVIEVLGSIDDLIENNGRRVEVLEEMARTIYREWFVRFRYPGHEDVPLVDSSLGPIPDGWAVRSLGELSTNHDRRRRPLSKAQRARRRGSFPYYGAAKLIDWIDGWIFDGEHLLFAEDGTVQTADGFPVLQLVEGKFWANNHTHILEGRDVPTRFLFLACAVQPIAGYVTGAAQPKITQANLNRLALAVATPDIQRRFDAIVDPIFDEWRSLQRSSAPLAALRDLLLPKLVTGQIEVSHLSLEALTEAATA